MVHLSFIFLFAGLSSNAVFAEEGGPCVDAIGSCHVLFANTPNFCEQYDIENACEKTCGRCTSSPTSSPTVSPSPAFRCEDEIDTAQCESFVQQTPNFCTEIDVNSRACDLTCGACTASPTPEPTESPTESPTIYCEYGCLKCVEDDGYESYGSYDEFAVLDCPHGCQVCVTPSPTASPTNGPTTSPTNSPVPPTASPTNGPTMLPTNGPTASPTASPAPRTHTPTHLPTAAPSPVYDVRGTLTIAGLTQEQFDSDEEFRAALLADLARSVDVEVDRVAIEEVRNCIDCASASSRIVVRYVVRLPSEDTAEEAVELLANPSLDELEAFGEDQGYDLSLVGDEGDADETKGFFGLTKNVIGIAAGGGCLLFAGVLCVTIARKRARSQGEGERERASSLLVNANQQGAASSAELTFEESNPLHQDAPTSGYV